MSGRIKSLDASQDGLHAAYTLEFAPQEAAPEAADRNKLPGSQVAVAFAVVIAAAAVSQKAAHRPSCVETPVPLRVVRFSYHEASFLHFSQTRQPNAKWPAFHGQGLFHRDMFPVAPPSFVYLPRSGACAMPACTRFRTGFTPRRVSPSPLRDWTLTLTQHRTDAGTPTG
ncbi:hypothetical protein CMUS01_00446 [Colletotrichum musicola]|uniref:Uncharacterized protein n=1 Tax=Colletotrichum musicola TaxID=2175873 RepID=A0A8H6NYM0_9PEZI|nr:hypothetical protein CMUS01_00446 [Colletotrichum musicola]